MVLIIFAVMLLIILIISFAAWSKHDKGDYGDGGGMQVGGDQETHFFMPANDRAGIWGERIVNYHLRPLLRQDEYLLANLLLPLKNGHKTEIDCVLISRKGIFCIETKNWVGHISGNDEDEYWLQEYDDPCMSNRSHKNPVKQNEGHCALLERLLNRRYSVDNAVIFADLEDGWGINSDHSFTVFQFKNYYRNLPDGEIQEEEIKQIYQKLLRYVASQAELEQHRIDVKSRFDN